MRTLKEATPVTKSNVGETKRATIKASAKIFNFFSEQIYSDKYTAIWRELVANAIDAQKMNGETRPPIVTAPSMLEPYAKVRDFGCSMDHEFMMDKFMAFTDASTKEHSDDFIGGFGIGSKAPLAYTQQYSIKCYLGGIVRVYSIFKDEEDCPSIAFLSEDSTDEPDGVEVGFPVRQDDVQRFTDTLVKTLQYFNPLPILEGTELELKAIEYDVRGDKWGIRFFEPNGNRNGRIIVGGVSYPLDSSAITYTYKNLRKFMNMGLDIFLDIGEVNIALSREHVTHDEELLTKIESILEGIAEEYGKQLSAKFAGAKTLWEAKALLNDLIEDADYSLREILQNYAVWDGDKITGNIMAPKLPLLYVAYGNFGYNYKGRQHGHYGIPTTEAVSPRFRAWTDNCRFQPHTFDMIVWDDDTDKSTLRMRTCVEANSGKRILIVRNNAPDDKDDVTLKQFLEAIGNPPGALVTKLSSYKPAKVHRNAPGSVATRPFSCYVRDTNPYVNSSRDHALPSDGGMYIVMNNFAAKSSSNDIQIARRSKPENIVWLNLTDFKASGIENDPKWYSVEEGVKKVKEEYRKEYKDLPEATGWHMARQDYSMNDVLLHIDELAELDNFPKRGPLLQILRLHEKHKDVTTTEHQAVRRELLKVDGTGHFARIRKLVEDVKAKHPLIAELCDDSMLFRRSSNEMKNRLF